MTRFGNRKKITALLLTLCMSFSSAGFAGVVTAAPEENALASVLAEEEIIRPEPLVETNVPEIRVLSESGVPIYQDEDYSFEERAADIVARLTATEKLNQMVSGHAPAIPRLGIGWWGWWNEALHGVSRYQNLQNTAGTTTVWNTTSYPIPLSMGHSWDEDIMYRVASAIGEEARETADGNYRNLSFYTPTVNLSRDPRWGRGDESQGEDPFQSAAIASQFINGMEGKDMDGALIDDNGYYQSLTTLKHYVANNTENNRVNGSSNMTERDLREYYTDVYRRIVEKSDPASVMSSYQRINEVPSTVNVHTLETLLRQTFGFTGFVTTDCDSMGAVIQASRNVPYAVFSWDAQPRQGGGHAWRPKAMPGLATSANDAATAYPADNPNNAVITNSELIAWSSFAGTDLECNGGVNGLGGSANGTSYSSPNGGAQALVDAPETPMGKFTENAVDINTHRMLTARMKTGEFDRDKGIVSWYDDTKERIADEYGEDWTFINTADNGAVTMTDERLDLAREAAAKTLVLLRNDPVEDNANKPLLPLSDALMAKEDLKVAVIGYAANPNFGPSAGDIGYVNGNQDKMQGGYSARFGGEGFDKFVYPLEGIETALKAENPNATVTFHKGTNLGIENSDFHPNSWTEASTEAVQSEITTLASEADIVITYVHTNLNSANEERDRGTSSSQSSDNFANSNLGIAPGQIKMIDIIKGVAADKMVLVMETSGPNFIEDFESGIPAMIFSSFNGQEKGNGLADVLLGNYNPSARTSVTWFDEGQLTHLLSYKMAPGTDDLVNYRGATAEGNTQVDIESMGRTYMYYDEEENGAVRYPFGYGLSYSTFEYSNFDISDEEVTPDDTITVSFDVKNTSAVAGSTVPQLYVKTPDSFGDQYPIKRLRGFEMVKLEAGETKTVSIDLPIEEFKFFNDAAEVMKFEVKPGAYVVQISDSSAEADVHESWDVEVTGTLTPKVSVVSAKPVIATEDAAAKIPQRLLFDVDKEVDPQLTIAMSDDALYGYVNALTDENTADYPFIDAPVKAAIPESMEITYESNRSDVVEVDGDTITTKAPGVATITATVTDTISGTTGTCEFIVYVLSPEGDDPVAESITVGGEPIEGFAADKLAYEVVLDRETDTAPTVAATSADGATVVVTQADGVPGAASIAITDAAKRTTIYNIYFGFSPEPDMLVSASGSWRIVRPAADVNAVSYGTEGTSWTVPRTVGQFITNQSSGGNAQPANVFLQDSIVGDWEATVKVSLSEIANGLHAGLTLYTSRSNNVQLVLYSGSVSAGWGQPSTLTPQIRFRHADNFGTATAVNGNNGVTYTGNGGTEVYLKLVKEGNVLSAFYSEDGLIWLSASGTDEPSTLTLNESYVFPGLGFFAGTDNALTDDYDVTFRNFILMDTLELPVPQNVSAFDGVEEVTVSWDTVPGAKGYTIYCSTVEGEDGTILGTVLDGSTGTFTKTGMMPGTYYLKVQANFGQAGDSLLSEQTEAEAKAEATSSGVTLATTPDDGKIFIDEEATIAIDYDSGSGEYAWTIEDATILEKVSSDNTTLVVKGLDTGISMVTATDVADDDIFAQAYIIVSEPEIESVTLDKETLDLTVGESGSLTPTILPSGAKDKTVSWRSANEDIATVENGVVSAVAEGSTTITVETVNGKTDTCTVTVSEVVQPPTIDVESVSLDESTMVMRAGSSKKLIATVLPLTATNKDVTWSSSNGSVATVDQAGNVQAVSEGVTVIQVTTDDGGFFAQCMITVRSGINVESVSLDESTMSLEIGSREKLTATVLPLTATNKDVTWSSSNTNVATVDQTGNVTAVSEGKATITVTTDDGGFTAECVVTVPEENIDDGGGSGSGSGNRGGGNGVKVSSDIKSSSDTAGGNDAATSIKQAESGNFVVTVQDAAMASLGTTNDAVVKITEKDMPTSVSAVLAEINAANSDIADKAYNISVSYGGKAVTNVDQMIAVTVDVSAMNLTDVQKAQMTGIYLSGNGTYSQLGGEFSADGKTFTFFSPYSGDHSVILSNNLKRIEFVIGSIIYSINNAQQTNDVAPVIKGGRTLLPLRVAAEALGAQVGWDEATSTATITRNGKTINVVIGQMLPGNLGAAELIDDRTYVPLRYIAQSLGANVVWDASTNSIKIYE